MRCSRGFTVLGSRAAMSHVEELSSMATWTVLSDGMVAGSLVDADACHFELSARAASALIASGTTPRSACQRPKQAAPRSPGLGSFFKTLLSCGVFLRMVGPRLQPGHPKPVQQLADRPLGQRDRPARGDLRAKIGAAPAYHSIALKIWPFQYQRSK